MASGIAIWISHSSPSMVTESPTSLADVPESTDGKPVPKQNYFVELRIFS